MKKYMILAALIAVMAMPLSVWAQQTDATVPKIGYVDMQRALQESQKGKQANETVMLFAEGLKKNITLKQEELQKLKDSIDKQSAMITAEGRAEKERQYQSKLKDYQRLVNDADGELQQKQMEVGQKIFKEIFEIVKNIGEKEKYTLILERAQGGVLFAAPAIDITAKVVAAYDESQKNAASAPTEEPAKASTKKKAPAKK